MDIRSNLVDIVHRRIFGAILTIRGERISHIQPTGHTENGFILPPFIDAHIHLESSLVSPAAFAEVALTHGTLGLCADPHEMANVSGMDGLRLMADCCSGLPFHFRIGVPSCVPATSFEDSPFSITPQHVSELLADARFHFLAEVMDIDAVLRRDPSLLDKIRYAQQHGYPIDGHAPLLTGDALRRYAQAGITTDHESETADEAREKINCGMNILIREGSDAQNFEALHSLIDESPAKLMFCSDDLRPDDLLKGHINTLVQRALNYGHNLFDVLRIASLNPAQHYRIPLGLLQPGDYADFIATDSLRHIRITDVVYHGKYLYKNSSLHHNLCLHDSTDPQYKQALPALHLNPVHPDSLLLPLPPNTKLRVITSAHGTLLTGEEFLSPSLRNGCAVPDTERDLVKLVVLNRYNPCQPPAIAFLQGTYLRDGAFAQSISHDNHHLIACGVNDDAIADALNAVIRNGGGISIALPTHETRTLQLPVGGLISTESVRHVAGELDHIQYLLASLRAPGAPPFPPLSFLSLIVIPSLKLSHKGLYHYTSASFVPPFVYN